MATKAFTESAGNPGRVTSARLPRATTETGAKSFIGLKRTPFIRLGVMTIVLTVIR